MVLAWVPPGSRFIGGELLSSVSLGSSTIAIGTAATPAKYRNAATFTAANAPTKFGNASAAGDALAAGEEIILTIAAAALPGAGKLVATLFFVDA